MNNIATNIESLYEKAKDYAEINVELVKLRTIDKTADVVSSLVVRLIIFLGVAMFLLFVNISLGLYIGDLLGKDYLGFLVVSGIYLLITVILSVSRNKIIKVPITNMIISKLLEEKKRSNNIKTEEDGVL
ncbi:hypothetical protein ACFSKN_03705 [Mariniflexile gromovii]|uniref:Superfamily III holin-X n=1 Tax=Mariniflexile gromovii TaxID=362523 RepID=A0ABS4BSV1_9FLAO|nr:hypothetical protein [Mariniflexile gromovii]MBP0903669.1 hypothetical protein [Mariniflexile gromovii]